MHSRLQKLMSSFLLLVFSILIMGVGANSSFASENSNIIKALDAEVAFTTLNQEEDEDEDDEDEEEERF